MKLSRLIGIGALAVALFSASVAFAQPDPGAASRPAAPRLLSPEVHSDRTVTFRYYWTGAGTTDQARERTIDLEAAVKAAGIKTSYKEIPGRHYWFMWRDFLVDYAQLLFK